jgi:cell cycle sensor histidine kinase DivJ
MVAVSDTGIGVSADDLPRLGEPFFQVRSGHDRPYEGTGLGLSVVRGLVGLHGGAVTFDSRPEGGLRVAVKLSARTASPEASADVVAPFPAPALAVVQSPAPMPPLVAGPMQSAPSELEPTVKKRA